jgi:hypothetical protein
MKSKLQSSLFHYSLHNYFPSKKLPHDLRKKLPNDLQDDLKIILERQKHDLDLNLNFDEDNPYTGQYYEKHDEAVVDYYSNYDNVKSYKDINVWMFSCGFGPYIRDKESPGNEPRKQSGSPHLLLNDPSAENRKKQNKIIGVESKPMDKKYKTSKPDSVAFNYSGKYEGYGYLLLEKTHVEEYLLNGQIKPREIKTTDKATNSEIVTSYEYYEYNGDYVTPLAKNFEEIIEGLQKKIFVNLELSADKQGIIFSDTANQYYVQLPNDVREELGKLLPRKVSTSPSASSNSPRSPTSSLKNSIAKKIKNIESNDLINRLSKLNPSLIQERCQIYYHDSDELTENSKQKPVLISCDKDGSPTIGDDDINNCPFSNKLPDDMHVLFNRSCFFVYDKAHLSEADKISKNNFINKQQEYVKKKKEHYVKNKALNDIEKYPLDLQFLILKLMDMSDECKSKEKTKMRREDLRFLNFIPQDKRDKGENIFDFAIKLLKQKAKSEGMDFMKVYGSMTLGTIVLKLVIDNKIGEKSNPCFKHGEDCFNPYYDAEARLSLGGQSLNTEKFLQQMIDRMEKETTFIFNDHPVRFHSNHKDVVIPDKDKIFIFDEDRPGKKKSKLIYPNIRQALLEASLINKLLSLIEEHGGDSEHVKEEFEKYCNMLIDNQQTHMMFCAHLNAAKKNPYIVPANNIHLAFLKRITKKYLDTPRDVKALEDAKEDIVDKMKKALDNHSEENIVDKSHLDTKIH